MVEQTYPIAQLFTSPQGEACHAGVLMRFIRLAGCNVGKYSVGPSEELAALRVLHPKHSICTSALGDSFLCDTDYHSFQRMTAEDAMNCEVDNVTAVCVTGGEPFMHNLLPFVKACKKTLQSLHIETSGTLPIPLEISKDAWITCSPKEGFLKENLGHIDEFKFLIAADTPITVLDKIYKITGNDDEGPDLTPCYLQPINSIDSIDMASVKRVLELQRLDPRLVVSVQLHKLLQVE